MFFNDQVIIITNCIYNFLTSHNLIPRQDIRSVSIYMDFPLISLYSLLIKGCNFSVFSLDRHYSLLFLIVEHRVAFPIHS